MSEFGLPKLDALAAALEEAVRRGWDRDRFRRTWAAGPWAAVVPEGMALAAFDAYTTVPTTKETPQ